MGRTKTLSWIHAQLTKEHTLVICGLSGIGKTRVAVEYVYTYRDEYDIVLWANADTQQTMERDICNIAKQLLEHHTGPKRVDKSEAVGLLGFTGIVDDKGEVLDDPSSYSQIAQAVKKFLSFSASGCWLLICDNYDNPNAFDLSTILPNRHFGKILITSAQRDHNEDWGSHTIEGLELSAGVQLLLQKSGNDQPGWVQEYFLFVDILTAFD